MRFAKLTFWIAAIYGILVLTPLYFFSDRVGRDAPPPITHPEFYYGFVGLALVWQFVFIFIARDPLRFRPIMPIAILEKLVYVVPVILLYVAHRLSPKMLPLALVDPLFGILFLLSYLKTAAESQRSR